jgi:pyridoxine 5-phosphate synthase
VLQIACQSRPHQATLVPERREEVTTEGGLDVVGQRAAVRDAVAQLRDAGIETSLFIDPDPRQIEASVDVGAQAVELHTGAYAHAAAEFRAADALRTLIEAGACATAAGLVLHAGHGLTYRNVQPVAQIPHMCELNIGHSIVARALMVGMERAVREMKRLIAG